MECRQKEQTPKLLPEEPHQFKTHLAQISSQLKRKEEKKKKGKDVVNFATTHLKMSRMMQRCDT